MPHLLRPAAGTSRHLTLLVVASALLLVIAGCGDDGSPSDESRPDRPAVNGADSSEGDRNGELGTGDATPGVPSDNGPSPTGGTGPSEPGPGGADTVTIRLINGNAAQPLTVVTQDPNGAQTWWRIIEPGTAPFVELRTLPFRGVCPCSEPDCDASLPPESPQETRTLQPGEDIEDSWDGTIWVRDTSAFPPCQYSQQAGPGPWRVQFTYHPGVEGEDGQIPQPSNPRSAEFRFGVDDEAALTTP